MSTRRIEKVIFALGFTGFLIALGSVGALEIELITWGKFFLQTAISALFMGAAALVYKLYENIL